MQTYSGPDRRCRQRTGWRATWVGKALWRIKYIAVFSNTIQTRMLLALAAGWWAAFLSLPGDSFARPTFRYMAAIAPEPYWIAAFASYGLLTLVRIVTDWNGRLAAIVINAVGATLFTAVAFAVVTLPGANFPAGAAAHCVLAMAACWVLLRTHVNSARDWTHD